MKMNVRVTIQKELSEVFEVDDDEFEGDITKNTNIRDFLFKQLEEEFKQEERMVNAYTTFAPQLSGGGNTLNDFRPDMKLSKKNGVYSLEKFDVRK